MSVVKRYEVGDSVRMNADAIAKYGEEFRGKTFVISYVATEADGLPGFDDIGYALYDFTDLNLALYDYELE